jgi:UDP-glucuronate 4-epimerase
VCERLLHSGHAVWAFDDLNNFYNPQLKRRNLREIQSLAPWNSSTQQPVTPSSPAHSTGRAKPFEFVHGDLTDRAALDELFGRVKFDQIIHLAARAGVRPSLEEPALYQRVNVEGTVNVLEAARNNGVKKITIASSSSVYGLNAKVPFSECDPIFSAISP